MAFELYADVVLITRRYTEQGVMRNKIGRVVQIHADGTLEVEFSNRQGSLLARIAVQPDEVMQRHKLTPEKAAQFRRALENLKAQPDNEPDRNQQSPPQE